MRNYHTLTLDELKAVLDYCPDTGVFTWKIRAANCVRAGEPAGSVHRSQNGVHRTIQIKGKNYVDARLAWLYTYGEMPARHVEHINGDSLDNRIANLRLSRGKVSELTHDLLLSLLRYDPDTGEFTWIDGSKRHGEVAGCVGLLGYKAVGVGGRSHRAHRLAWFYSFGVWPQRHLDHINGDKLDNRLNNLREATPAENSQNLKSNKRNTSGFAGVSRDKDKFKAQIRAHGETYYLGRFATAEQAGQAYLKAKAKPT